MKLTHVTALLTFALGAHAATTYYVSGSGSDSNPCTNSSPCRTFIGAYAKTSTGDTIAALDSADYSTGVTLIINHAITLDGGTSGARYSEPGVGGTGIDLTISDANNDTSIQNLTFFIGVQSTAVSASVTGANLRFDQVKFSSVNNGGTAISILGDQAANIDLKEVRVLGGDTGLFAARTAAATGPCHISVEGSTPWIQPASTFIKPAPWPKQPSSIRPTIPTSFTTPTTSFFPPSSA